MKHAILAFLFHLIVLVFGAPAQAQDCSLEAVATLTTELWGSEIAYTISDDNGILLSGENFSDYSTSTSAFCLDDVSGCLVLEMTDSFGDGWNGAVLYITVPTLGLSLGTFTLEEGNAQAITFGEGCETEEVEIEGCTDPLAFNYNPAATVDDGSCDYDCGCDDVFEPVCAYDFTTGEYITYINLCEAECAQAWFIAEGDCDDQPVYGCTDPEAVNYNPDATDDDGSCVVVPECGENEWLAVATLTTEMWGGEVSYTISDDNGILAEGQGVADYDSTATYFCLADSTGCLVLNMMDSFGDSWNGAALTVTVPDQGLSLGTFTLAVGASQAVTFGLDCETEEVGVEGCTDPLANNYNPLATVDDGSCDYGCGCEDVYEPVCALDFATGELITFANACEAECVGAFVVADGDCDDQPVFGCTDPEALNYNPDATDDDGSCVGVLACADGEAEVLVTLHTALWGSEVSFILSDANGVVAEGEGYADYGEYFTSFCLSDSAGCLQLEMIDSFGDGWNDATIEISIPSQDLSLGTFTLETGNFQAISFGIGCETVEVETEGCTDPFAFNYDPYATVDDGSCSYDCECEDIYDPVCGYDWLTGEYVTYNNECEAGCAQAYIIWYGDCADQPIHGCTDEEAINYNPNATEDNGSCVYIPECGPDETAIAIEVISADSTSELGFSVYWNLTDSTGFHVTSLVYDYSNWEASNAYGCVEDGCYNFFMYDYGWELGAAQVNITLGDETTTYTFEEGQFEAAYAIGVNTEGCEIFIPVYGCMDPEAMNYNPDANIDDGYCLYPCECEEVYDPVCAYDYFTGDYVTFNNACEAECWNAWIVWYGDCADQPIYGCTDPAALNYNPDATDDDGSCAFIPECGDAETELIIQTMAGDSLDEFGGYVSLHWSLTTDLGQPVTLVYDYQEFQTISYGCVADGCYNFYLSDFGWTPGMNTAEVILDGVVSTYTVPVNDYSAIYALGVNTDGCEVTIPGCTDPEALNYYSAATVDDGSCQYPFICETGEVGYVYLYTSILSSTLDIVSDADELVFSGDDVFNFGGVYGEVCLEADVCYTAIITGDVDNNEEWNDGIFGVSTTFQDVAYTEWPIGEGVWAVQFSLNATCEEFDWEQYLGCTDPEASNYNPDALVDDGSCVDALLCGGDYEVEFVLNGGLDPDEVGLNVTNEDGETLMEMDGYTGSSVGCVPPGCYTVEMLDSSGDGWEGAMAELYVDGEYVDFMTLEEGSYELRVIGLGVDCEEDETSNVDVFNAEDWAVELFPNPGQDQLTIRSSFTGGDATPTVLVYNADGRLVMDLSGQAQGVDGNWQVDAAGWAPGMYIVHVTQNDTTRRLPWVKVR